MRTIVITGDFILVETLTRWIRELYTVVSEFDKAVEGGIERVLRVRQ